MQLLLDVAPVAAEYRPAPQAVHVVLEVAPVAAEYRPATQFLQPD